MKALLTSSAPQDKTVMFFDANDLGLNKKIILNCHRLLTILTFGMRFDDIYSQLKAATPQIKKTSSFVGFDGTIDYISRAVDKRYGRSEDYTPIKTIESFGQRIEAAAGKSTNIELFCRQTKIGGNAAIMASALVAAGVKTTLVADLGTPKIHPIFQTLAKKATLKSLGAPTETHAVEFDDGKIMLGYTVNHEAITFESIKKAFGGEKKLKVILNSAKLISLVNWTMTPGMTEIYEKIPRLLKKDLNRMVFFDLADPQKRSPDELKKALLFISKFSAVRQSVLGLNLKEAQQVAAALSLSIVSGDEADLPLVAKNIREKLNLSCVVIHAVAVAASSSATGEYKIVAPYVQHRKVTTGAGDHFNAGFALGLMLGVSPDAALALGVTFAGFYINTGISPKYSDALAMVRRGW